MHDSFAVELMKITNRTFMSWQSIDQCLQYHHKLFCVKLEFACTFITFTHTQTDTPSRHTTIRRIWQKRKSLKRAPYHWQWNHITVSLITSNLGMVAQTNADSNKPQQHCGLVVVWTKWNSSTQLLLIMSILFFSGFASCHTTKYLLHTFFLSGSSIFIFD